MMKKVFFAALMVCSVFSVNAVTDWDSAYTIGEKKWELKGSFLNDSVTTEINFVDYSSEDTMKMRAFDFQFTYGISESFDIGASFMSKKFTYETGDMGEFEGEAINYLGLHIKGALVPSTFALSADLSYMLESEADVKFEAQFGAHFTMPLSETFQTHLALYKPVYDGNVTTFIIENTLSYVTEKASVGAKSAWYLIKGESNNMLYAGPYASVQLTENIGIEGLYQIMLVTPGSDIEGFDVSGSKLQLSLVATF